MIYDFSQLQKVCVTGRSTFFAKRYHRDRFLRDSMVPAQNIKNKSAGPGSQTTPFCFIN